MAAGSHSHDLSLASLENVLREKGLQVRQSSALERLAKMDVLCLDKTGVLTSNHYVADEPVLFGGGTSAAAFLLDAALCSVQSENLDAIDKSVLDAVPEKAKLKDYKVLELVPFDPRTKRTEAKVQSQDGKIHWITRGAPSALLGIATNTDVKDAALKAVDEMSIRGVRCLGVARAETEGQWIFAGLLPFTDPVVPGTAEVIKGVLQRGIKVKMITGDSVRVAKTVAQRLGMGTNFLTREDLRNCPELPQKILHADGFAEVFPEDKVKIIKCLQAHGHIVGMVGDGVNDAPAIKQANVGIAADGAKEACVVNAGLVLLTPGLMSLARVLSMAAQGAPSVSTISEGTAARTCVYDLSDSSYLAVIKGDKITGIKAIDDKWLEGECNGRRGRFPRFLIIDQQEVERAARDGNASAQAELAIRLTLLDHTSRSAAFSWAKRSADQGCVEGIDALSLCYWCDGFGVEKDVAMAMSLAKKAYEQSGSLTRLMRLAVLHENTKDLQGAFAWYEKAAMQGNSECQYRAGRFLATGRGGIPVNKTQAMEWFRRAAQQGDADAAEALKRLESGQQVQPDESEGPDNEDDDT